MPLRLKGNTPQPGEPDRRYYMIDVQEGNRRVRLSSGTRNKALAEQKEQAVLDALRADIEIPHADLQALVRGNVRAAQASISRPPKGMTLKEACDDALCDRQPWGRSRKGWADCASRSTYSGQLRDIQRILGADFPILQFNAESVETIIQDLMEEADDEADTPGRRKAANSGTTINRKMFALYSVIRRLHDRELPAPKLPRYTPFDESDNARQFTFTHEQEKELFDALLVLDTLPDGNEGGHPRKRDAHEYRDLFIVLADVGCRLTAGLNITWKDLSNHNGIPFVQFFRRRHLKGGKQRTTPLSARAQEVIERRRKLGGTGPFSTLNKRRAQHLWTSAKSRTSLAGETEAVIHALRHTCATRMLRATGDIKLVQEWLGHSALQTTSDIYAKVLIGHKVDALKAFEAEWTGTRSIPETGEIRDGYVPETGIEKHVTH